MAQQQQQQALKHPLQVVKDSLLGKGAIQMFKDNLPHATGEHAEKLAQRFAKMVYTTVSQNAALQKCSVPSIIKAASISASLDLDIDPRGLAYLVPYGTEAQFQIGYMGLIELAYRSGKVKAISAHCIYDSEREKVIIKRIDGRFEVIHPFSYEKPTGEIIAVYATAEVEGLGAQTVVLRKDEIERFRQVSKAPNSPAWKDHYEAMAKKTVIRQLAKFLPKSILEDFSRGAAMDEQESFHGAQANAEQQINENAGSEVIDVSFETAASGEPDWMKATNENGTLKTEEGAA